MQQRRVHTHSEQVKQISTLKTGIIGNLYTEMQECTSAGVSGDALRVAGIWDASRVSSMLPWKGLGMSSATARTTGLRDKLGVAPVA